MPKETKRLLKQAEHFRVEYIDAVNRRELEAALRIGVEQLLPISERLASLDDGFHDPHGITLRNLAGICQLLDRPISGLCFIQAAFHSAVLLDTRSLPMDPALGGTGRETATFARSVYERHRTLEDPSLPESEMIVPAASLIPSSIEAMQKLDSFPWACTMRAAATTLRHLEGSRDFQVAEVETRSMVMLARFAHERSDTAFAASELREALGFWIRTLDQDVRYWSTDLLETWVAAAELLDAMHLPAAATALRRACGQATRRGGFGLSGLAETLDLRDHYRAALAALPQR